MLLPSFPNHFFLKSKKAREQLLGRYQQGLQDQGSIDLQFNLGSPVPLSTLHVFLAGNMTGASRSHSLVEETSHHMDINVKSSWGLVEREQSSRADLGKTLKLLPNIPTRGPRTTLWDLFFTTEIQYLPPLKIIKFIERNRRKNTFNLSNSSDLKQKKTPNEYVNTCKFFISFLKQFHLQMDNASGVGQGPPFLHCREMCFFALHFSHCSVGKQLRCNFGSSSGCEMSVLASPPEGKPKLISPRLESSFPASLKHIKFINHLSRKKIRFPDFYFVGHEN